MLRYGAGVGVGVGDVVLGVRGGRVMMGGDVCWHGVRGVLTGYGASHTGMYTGSGRPCRRY